MEKDCPFPYANFMGECFYASKYKLKWHDARQYCLDMNGDLAVPTMLYALKTYVIEERVSRSTWIGGLDEEDGQRLALGERAAHRRQVLGTGKPWHGPQDSTVSGANTQPPPPSEEQAVFLSAQVHLPIQLEHVILNQRFYVSTLARYLSLPWSTYFRKNSNDIWLSGDWSKVYYLDCSRYKR
ncbi:uncharacterized protein LOC125044267 [Penaeus chinensis]|uniref:uncharacterized protein LOC125044267 n=1 Tax=Penaeus chinensis TaxID=139456 RepID=UPI001FB84713|nr:uncharacterized protein LOC125044267 [Penaeus chinensis]XP_047496801.1 uncharacterized protein LOC125044267 [Penaeus chinensis]XP_047496803.1 uncharacterized protein LOC125044267 [Penaeus chinensis]